MDRCVDIYADGRLVYTGVLSLAARRLGVRPDLLEDILDAGQADFRKSQPRAFVSDGFEYPVPRAREYIARWRD